MPGSRGGTREENVRRAEQVGLAGRGSRMGGNFSFPQKLSGGEVSRFMRGAGESMDYNRKEEIFWGGEKRKKIIVCEEEVRRHIKKPTRGNRGERSGLSFWKRGGRREEAAKNGPIVRERTRRFAVGETMGSCTKGRGEPRSRGAVLYLFR